MSVDTRSISSYNSRSASLYRQFITPSPLQAVIYVLTGVLILILIKAREIWTSLSSSITIEDSERAAFNTPASNNIWGDISSSILPQLLFWGTIGVLMYAVVWFIWNIITNLRNDMAADEFVHPKNYDRTKYWHTVLARKGFFAVSGILLLVYIFAIFKFLPVIADVAYTDVASFSFPGSLLGLCVYLITVALLIHIFVLLLRLTAHAWQSIYRDL